MKIKLKDIIENKENLISLQQVDGFPFKVSYRIKRLIDKLNPEVKSFEEKRNDLIVKKYGEKDPESENYSIKDPKKLEQFAEDLKSVMEEMIEVDFDPISIEEIGDVKIAPKDIVEFVFK
jgi:hypothetical protein